MRRRGRAANERSWNIVSRRRCARPRSSRKRTRMTTLSSSREAFGRPLRQAVIEQLGLSQRLRGRVRRNGIGNQEGDSDLQQDSSGKVERQKGLRLIDHRQYGSHEGGDADSTPNRRRKEPVSQNPLPTWLTTAFDRSIPEEPAGPAGRSRSSICCSSSRAVGEHADRYFGSAASYSVWVTSAALETSACSSSSSHPDP